MNTLLWADVDTGTHGALSSCFKGRFNHLFPSTFDDLLGKVSLNSCLAVIDAGFSGNRGLEALMSLKAARPSLPVIFTTSHGSESLCLKAFRLGARDYFTKPMHEEALAKCIDGILCQCNGSKGRGGRRNLLLDMYGETIVQAEVSRKVTPNIEKAMRFIGENFSETVSLQQLARIACISKFHFCRTFKKQLGVTCTEYLTTVRVREAKRLLKRGSMTVSEICLSVGYNDLAHFERTFKGVEGVSPSVYRRECYVINPLK